MSARRRGQLDARKRVRATVLARDRGCVGPARGLDGACWGPLDVHELLPRGRGGDWLDPSNCVCLCRGHHSLVTDRPAEGYRTGLVHRTPPVC